MYLLNWREWALIVGIIVGFAAVMDWRAEPTIGFGVCVAVALLMEWVLRRDVVGVSDPLDSDPGDDEGSDLDRRDRPSPP